MGRYGEGLVRNSGVRRRETKGDPFVHWLEPSS